MNRNELNLALRTRAFLDAHVHDPDGILELRTGPTRRILVWHPDAIDWIFQADRHLRHQPSRTLIPLLGRQSLLWTDGDRHLAYRRTLGPALRGHQLVNYRQIITDTTNQAIDALVPGTVFRLPDWTRTLTLRIIGQIVFHQASDAMLAEFARWINRALGSRFRTLTYRHVLGGLPSAGAALDRMLVHAARSGESTGPLARLLLADDSPVGVLADGELRDQVVSLLFAGHETTASTVAWTLYWLSRDETVRRDVVAELTATSDDGSDVTRFPLLQAVIQEVLRLCPPAPVAGNRVLTEDGELLGRPMAAGTVLVPSIYLAQHQSGLFPQPYRFDPTRFLGTRVPSRSCFPFGGGIRHCLGNELATLELRMITASVFRNRRLRCLNPNAATARLRGPAMAPSPRLLMKVIA
ncbi:MAG TPA: cytochrome P450 [Pseudonocardiaceae bacterium]|jgi:cytochrome P450|nr:cytochrome P450 [Pseudonocardiaceae bacterium]